MPSRRLFVLLCLAVVLLLGVVWWYFGGGEAALGGAAGPSNDRLAQQAQARDDPTAVPAIRELALRKSDKDYATIERLTREAATPAARAEAAASLGLYPKQADVPQMISQARGEHNAVVLAGRVRGLARLSNPKHPKALPLFVDLLSHPDAQVRLQAITGLTNITIVRFPDYQAQRSPEELHNAIGVIKDFLRHHSLL